MPVSQRLLWLRSCIMDGYDVSVHVSCNAVNKVQKVKFLVKGGGYGNSQLDKSILLSTVDSVSTMAFAYKTNDGGHRHSNGVSEVCIWFRPYDAVDSQVQDAPCKKLQTSVPKKQAFRDEPSMDIDELQFASMWEPLEPSSIPVPQDEEPVPLVLATLPKVSWSSIHSMFSGRDRIVGTIVHFSTNYYMKLWNHVAGSSMESHLSLDELHNGMVQTLVEGLINSNVGAELINTDIMPTIHRYLSFCAWLLASASRRTCFSERITDER
eukprot:TRINITY_DN36695_c0_g1_i2.p1 TRINITY_DN36695_c0_g1~~TRINITY_DN36695_c0_g1_i2.p1  ORF type:complete len:267 (-),score=26.67 TRINITY_DN36695_c0_g1_i2:284-1084(-)